MPFLVSSSTGIASGGPHIELDQLAYGFGAFTRTTTFASPFADTTYRVAFNLGNGVAVPVITVTNKTVNGFTWSFLAVSSGTVFAVAVP